MEQTIELFDAIVRLATLVLPVIGVAGGRQGLLGELPDLRIWRWEIPYRIYVSWSAAGLLLVVAHLAGDMSPPSAFETAELWLAFEWSVLAGLANYVHSVAYDRGAEIIVEEVPDGA